MQNQTLYPNEDLEEENENKLKKIFLKVLSITLIFLIMSYIIILNPYLNTIINSLFESSISNDNIITSKGKIIIFENNTLNKIQDIYTNNIETETVFCLSGIIEGNKYKIFNFYIPKIYDQTYDHVSFQRCNKNTIIVLHTHPPKRCIASRQDIATLADLRNFNSNLLFMIMCEDKKFTIY